MGFSILIVMLFILYSILTYREVHNLQQGIHESNHKIAREELLKAIQGAEIDIKGHARDFSNWEEIHQQISNPLYYAYWHEHRALKAGLLPKYINDVSVYDKTGHVLSNLETTKLPLIIERKELNSYVDINDNKLELVVFQEVYGKKMIRILLAT